MKTNRYKQAMLAEKIDEQKFEDLINRLENGEATTTVTDTKTGKSRHKLRFSAILAAALIIAAVCVTTSVAVSSGGWRMREFYNERNRSKGFTVMENPDENAGDIAITATTDSGESSLIEPKLVSVSGDGHTIAAIVEVDIKDLDLPEEAKNSGSIGFYSVSSNLDEYNNYLPTLISTDGTIYRYACTFSPIREMPEGSIIIELCNFGYDIGNGFEVAASGTFRFEVDAACSDNLGDKVKISGRKQVKGATLQLELTPLGLTVYGSYSELKKLNLYYDKYYLAVDKFKFRKSDGSILCDEDDWFDTDLYQIIGSVTGDLDIDADVAIHHYGFMVPVDISEIEAVAIHDVWFELDSVCFDNLSDKIKISGEAQVKGATLHLQLSPLGLTVYGSYSELTGLGLYEDKYFLAQGDCFKFRKSDGSVLGEEESFFDTDFYNIVTTVSGRADPDTDVASFHYGFIAPVDISEIEAVAVHDVWFELGEAGGGAPANAEAGAPNSAENLEGTVSGN